MRFRGNGPYPLDEPEAALSPMRQLAMLGRIRRIEFEETEHYFVIRRFMNDRVAILNELPAEDKDENPTG
jgi:predicted ATPase